MCLCVSVLFAPRASENARVCVSPPVRISHSPSRWASTLDKAQGLHRLHLDLYCANDYVDDNAEAPSPSPSVLTLLSAASPDSYSSLTISQASSVRSSCVSAVYSPHTLAGAMPLGTASMGWTFSFGFRVSESPGGFVSDGL